MHAVAHSVESWAIRDDAAPRRVTMAVRRAAAFGTRTSSELSWRARSAWESASCVSLVASAALISSARPAQRPIVPRGRCDGPGGAVDGGKVVGEVGIDAVGKRATPAPVEQAEGLADGRADRAEVLLLRQQWAVHRPQRLGNGRQLGRGDGQSPSTNSAMSP